MILKFNWNKIFNQFCFFSIFSVVIIYFCRSKENIEVFYLYCRSNVKVIYIFIYIQFLLNARGVYSEQNFSPCCKMSFFPLLVFPLKKGKIFRTVYFFIFPPLYYLPPPLAGYPLQNIHSRWNDELINWN